MSVDIKYEVSATATGGGREGNVKTEDGALDLKMVPPKALGGAGDGHNPEQLFATGYAACYLGAMRFAASQDKSLPKIPEDAKVTATVGIGPRSDKGFGLKVNLKVDMPGIDKADAQKIADAGHGICPYSHATKGNIEVTTEVV
ncbi:organic hydroperoxide resistance protein [Tepidamorphus sp. 3E244]|uniref:organic hydroperoxide resistance protein n=1 Tax=Tepidamorphus sp. 3E244 TaxID=3385498 RepID=UPI0038FC3E1F